LLGGELLRHGQLVFQAAQRYEVQGLRVLHHGTEQAAHPQRLRAFQRQGGTGQGVIEHTHQRTIDRRLRRALGQHLGGQHLGLQQRAHRHLRGVEAGEGGHVGAHGLLQGDGQVARRRLAHRHVAAQGQGLGTAGLHQGLATAFKGQLEQQLKGLAALFKRDDLGVHGFPRADQPGLRFQQLEQLAGSRQRPGSGG